MPNSSRGVRWRGRRASTVSYAAEQIKLQFHVEADSMSPGPFTLEVRNDSSSTGSFELFRLGVPYDEFAAYYAEENEILQAGQPPRVSEGIGELPEATDVHRVLEVAPGGSGELVGDLTEGTYAVLCEQLDEAGDYAGVFSVGPFDVTA